MSKLNTPDDPADGIDRRTFLGASRLAALPVSTGLPGLPALFDAKTIQTIVTPNQQVQYTAPRVLQFLTGALGLSETEIQPAVIWQKLAQRNTSRHPPNPHRYGHSVNARENAIANANVSSYQYLNTLEILHQANINPEEILLNSANSDSDYVKRLLAAQWHYIVDNTGIYHDKGEFNLIHSTHNGAVAMEFSLSYVLNEIIQKEKIGFMRGTNAECPLLNVSQIQLNRLVAIFSDRNSRLYQELAHTFSQSAAGTCEYAMQHDVEFRNEYRRGLQEKRGDRHPALQDVANQVLGPMHTLLAQIKSLESNDTRPVHLQRSEAEGDS